MSIIKTARTHTGLNQTDFGEFLGQLARGKPIAQKRISEYEHGHIAPSQTVRKAALPFAAKELKRQLMKAPHSAMESLIIEAML